LPNRMVPFCSGAAPINLAMSSHSESGSPTLQTCVGILSIIAIFIALAGLHYRDSLACVFLRRFRRSRVECEPYVSTRYRQ
jgi:hypothetical protein